MTRREFFFGLMFQKKPTTLQVQVMEVFSDSNGPSALLVHHANEATRNAFAEWLHRNDGAAIVCTAQRGTRIRGRIFRVRMCFGRGFVLTTSSGPIQIRPKDVLIIESQ